MNPDTMNSKVYGILGTLDLFAIWYAVLIGIGIAVIAKVPRARGYTISAIVFVVTSLLLGGMR
jgi:hypothetical protein